MECTRTLRASSASLRATCGLKFCAYKYVGMWKYRQKLKFCATAICVWFAAEIHGEAFIVVFNFESAHSVEYIGIALVFVALRCVLTRLKCSLKGDVKCLWGVGCGWGAKYDASWKLSTSFWIQFSLQLHHCLSYFSDAIFRFTFVRSNLNISRHISDYMLRSFHASSESQESSRGADYCVIMVYKWKCKTKP